jgi:predicted nuclease of predicted toxin-antitoxin system
VRFLVDNALSPELAVRLCRAGHDAIHVRALGLHRADDSVILDRAAAEDRIVVSTDSDFSTLMAHRHGYKPSIIQFRGAGTRRPDALAERILAHLPRLVPALESGGIVTFEAARVRVRALPIDLRSE